MANPRAVAIGALTVVLDSNNFWEEEEAAIREVIKILGKGL